MHRTAWSKQNSSLPSDRIKPVVKGPTNVAKTKGKQQQAEPPKSKGIRRLEYLLEDIQKSSGHERDPKSGCFCLARMHDLSPYIPICKSCGLILCSFNVPYYACSHCGSDLMTPTVRESLISQLDSQLASTIAREIVEKEREIEEAQRAAGAFPTLHGGLPQSSPAQPSLPLQRQTHKVMSLTSNSKRVLVSSYTTTPVSSRPVSTTEELEEEPHRVPPPPPEPAHAATRPTSQRPWENLVHEAIVYTAPSRLDDEGGNSKAPSRRRRGNVRKGKETEMEQSGGPKTEA